MQMKGVGQHHLGAGFGQLGRADALDGGRGAHRHEARRVDDAMGGVEMPAAGPGLATAGRHREGEGWWRGAQGGSAGAAAAWGPRLGAGRRLQGCGSCVRVGPLGAAPAWPLPFAIEPLLGPGPAMVQGPARRDGCGIWPGPGSSIRYCLAGPASRLVLIASPDSPPGWPWCSASCRPRFGPCCRGGCRC